jgi:hypothetical protein
VEQSKSRTKEERKRDLEIQSLILHGAAMAIAGSSEPKVDTIVEFVEEIDPRTARLRAANVRPP